MLFLAVVNEQHVTVCVIEALMGQLCDVPAVVTRESSCRMSRRSLMSAVARIRGGRFERRTIAKCARQHKCGVVGAVENCTQFDPNLGSPSQDGGEGLHKHDENLRLLSQS